MRSAWNSLKYHFTPGTWIYIVWVDWNVLGACSLKIVEVTFKFSYSFEKYFFVIPSKFNYSSSICSTWKNILPNLSPVQNFYDNFVEKHTIQNIIKHCTYMRDRLSKSYLKQREFFIILWEIFFRLNYYLICFSYCEETKYSV